MQFPKDNEIAYQHDGKVKIGVPSDASFDAVIDQEGHMILSAPGYGSPLYPGKGKIIIGLSRRGHILDGLRDKLGDVAYGLLLDEVKQTMVAAVKNMK